METIEQIATQLQWTVTTTITGDAIIKQSVIDALSKTTTDTIADTKEVHLREALIKLGWTPPEVDVSTSVKRWKCACSFNPEEQYPIIKFLNQGETVLPGEKMIMIESQGSEITTIELVEQFGNSEELGASE